MNKILGAITVAALIVSPAAQVNTHDKRPGAAPGSAWSGGPVAVTLTAWHDDASDDYLAMLHLGKITGVGDDELLADGRALCKDLDSNGADFDAAALDTVTASGLRPYEVGELIGAATKFLCPTYADAADKWGAS